MVPDTFHDFFVASAGVSGALIGLLFVAISVAPESVVKRHAPAVAQETAIGAFMVLTSTLMIALSALIPGGYLGFTAAATGIGGIVGTVMYAILTWLHRAEGGAGVHWAIQRTLSLGVFAVQVAVGFAIPDDGDATEQIKRLCALSLVLYLVALSRAWELLGARGHGVSDLFVALREERVAHAKQAPESAD